MVRRHGRFCGEPEKRQWLIDGIIDKVEHAPQTRRAHGKGALGFERRAISCLDESNKQPEQRIIGINDMSSRGRLPEAQGGITDTVVPPELCMEWPEIAVECRDNRLQDCSAQRARQCQRDHAMISGQLVLATCARCRKSHLANLNALCETSGAKVEPRTGAAVRKYLQLPVIGGRVGKSSGRLIERDHVNGAHLPRSMRELRPLALIPG